LGELTPIILLGVCASVPLPPMFTLVWLPGATHVQCACDLSDRSIPTIITSTADKDKRIWRSTIGAVLLQTAKRHPSRWKVYLVRWFAILSRPVCSRMIAKPAPVFLLHRCPPEATDALTLTGWLDNGSTLLYAYLPGSRCMRHIDAACTDADNFDSRLATHRIIFVRPSYFVICNVSTSQTQTTFSHLSSQAYSWFLWEHVLWMMRTFDKVYHLILHRPKTDSLRLLKAQCDWSYAW